jgi:hypothetical protein
MRTDIRNKTRRAFFLMVMAVPALLVACSGDDIAADSDTPDTPDSQQKKTVTLAATVGGNDNSGTRVGMTKSADGTTATFYWNKGDAIWVQTVKDDTYSGAEFTTENSDGATTAYFKGDIDEDTQVGKYAFYPYNANHRRRSEKEYTFYMPATYDNYEVGSAIFSKTVDGTTTYPAASTNMPLIGIIEGDKIEFKHLGGVLVIRIDKMPGASGTLTVSSDNRLSSNFFISDITAEEVSMETPSPLNPADAKVTFNFINATKDAAGVFYLPLATGTYSNLKVSMTVDGGETKTADCGDITVSRAEINAMPLHVTSTGDLIKPLGNGKYYVNGHVFVDLGVSVLWAEENVGPGTGGDYDDFFAWGETSNKWGGYIYTNYKWTEGNSTTFTRYYSEDGLTTLKAEDDAATVNWGASCRTPTKAEFEELLKCTWTKTDTDYDEKTMGGYTVSGKDEYSGNSIFIPFMGYRYDSNYNSAGECFFCWTSSLNPDDVTSAYFCSNVNGYNYMSNTYRWSGMSVRAVVKK